MPTKTDEFSEFKSAYDLSIEALKRRVSMLELANKDKSEALARLIKRIETLELADKERTPEIAAVIHRISLLEDLHAFYKVHEETASNEKDMRIGRNG